jgi:cytochrome c oxidase subunit II
VPAAGLAGCQGVQSALDPAGPAAAAIARSWWVMAAAATLILTLVMALGLWAVYRRSDRRAAPRPLALIVGGGLVFPVVALTALLVYGLGLMELRAADTASLEIRVVAQRWQWEARYPAPAGAAAPVTLNELRIPAGRPVRVHLSSTDVIHSFWVPRLAGKMDVIPGHERHLVIQADAPGRFRGQCAEFCGEAHALMVFWVVALPPDEFDQWLSGAARGAGQ